MEQPSPIGKKLRMIPVEAHTLSVDTPKDLDYVRKVIQEKLERGEIVLVIEGAKEENTLLSLSPEEHLAACLAAGMSEKDAVKKVAAERGVPKNEIYRLTVKDR